MQLKNAISATMKSRLPLPLLDAMLAWVTIWNSSRVSDFVCFIHGIQIDSILLVQYPLTPNLNKNEALTCRVQLNVSWASHDIVLACAISIHIKNMLWMLTTSY